MRTVAGIQVQQWQASLAATVTVPLPDHGMTSDATNIAFIS
jgi:hypothetical protein